ncbi:hypothetical protein [Hymenobacter siberiensis]|uniref:hypothetical protein n=1 Tax=Hymenobacter siberiensis TaxID=2848396 RepID=UPI001C1E33F3|nr:hypothetical protein [Hymenobacter siberiensis]
MFRPAPDVLKAYDLSDLVPEADKLKAPYLIGNIDAAILQLVRSKRELRKYRDLYEGFRDPQEYAYLTENFGIGNPARVKMIPIIRNRVQVLLGQHLQNPIKKKITCTDQKSIASLEQEKLEHAVQQVGQQLAAELQTLLQTEPAGPAPAGAAAPAAGPQRFGDAQLQALNESMHSFQSGLETSAQHALDEMLQSPDLRLKEKFTTLLEKLLVESQPFYRVVPRQSGHMPGYEVVPPEELHFSLPPGERWLRHCTRFVRRQLWTRQRVLSTYGHLLSKDEREVIAGHKQMPNLAWDILPLGGERYLDYFGPGGLQRPGPDSAYWNESPTHRDQQTLGANAGDLVEVFHVEWVATNAINLDEEDAPEGYTQSGEWEEGDFDPTGSMIELTTAEQQKARKSRVRYREDRYEGVRIGSNIYCALGRTKNVPRSMSDPWSCSCSYRGYVHDFSLVGKTKDIQDSSDILHYHADNLVASSGVKGSTVDMALIPKWLDPDPATRAAKHKAHRKQGSNLVDSSQDGVQAGRGNAVSGDYDESLDGNSLRAIREQIAYLDEVAGSITGVNRQMLGAITDQDLVGNTDAARVQSTLITKPLFQIIDTLIQDSLTDLLNAARTAYKAGRKGVLTLGELGQKVFTLHANFPLADYSVFVADGQEETKQLQEFKQWGKDFIAAKLMQPEDALDLVTNTSLSDVRANLKRSAANARAKQEQEMQQQIEQLTKQLQDAQTQLAGVDQAKQQQMQAELAIKQQLAQLESQRVANDKDTADKTLALKEEEVALERDQIAFSNKALEVKNVV